MAIEFNRDALRQYVTKDRPILNGRQGGYTNLFDGAHYATEDAALTAAFASIRVIPNAAYGKSVAELQGNV